MFEQFGILCLQCTHNLNEICKAIKEEEDE
jgi:hypothetical protein